MALILLVASVADTMFPVTKHNSNGSGGDVHSVEGSHN